MLNLKPTHKGIKDYYNSLTELSFLVGAAKETSIRHPFQRLLEDCSKKTGLIFQAEYTLKLRDSNIIVIDGAIIDKFSVPLGYWEAKDLQDDLAIEVKKKFERGYPKDNIIFWTPERIILYQDSYVRFDEKIADPENLVKVLKAFFDFRSELQLTWEKAVEDFRSQIPEAAKGVIKLIETERAENHDFKNSFGKFAVLCRSSINPNLSDAAIEEMLVQHLLTQRIFSTIFNAQDFVRKNVIAREIENVIDSLTSRKFSRDEFFRPLDRFYVALENRAKTLDDYLQKQTFLNTVYEKFFQGFAVKVADVYGIVYTPQPIVEFIVRSVEEILKREFSRSLNDPNVNIIDPFAGTGSFVVRVMNEIKKTSLEFKYAEELHANEVMLLPYYVASMNIEREYYEKVGYYKPFDGMCLVDTFDLAEKEQPDLAFSEENTGRINKLKSAKLFVIIGNPPYNVGQIKENDNNKNRTYPAIKERVYNTYSHDSLARNKNKLGDPYVKAIRWASDKIIENGEGVIAFITNNCFIDAISFDGMRKHLASDFELVYIVDLKGNIREDSMKDGIALGEKHTVFGLSAMVGVSINFFIKKPSLKQKKIFYSDVDFRATREDKFRFLENGKNVYGLKKREIIPDEKHNWLTWDLESDFASMPCLTSKKNNQKTQGIVFSLSSAGVKTNRDVWVYSYDYTTLCRNVQNSIDAYNEHLFRRPPPKDSKALKRTSVDKFVNNDDPRISWSGGLKGALIKDEMVSVTFESNKIRRSVYRPFSNSWLYFDGRFNERRYQMPHIFPTAQTESENQVICVSGPGHSKPFQCLVTNLIPSCDMLEKTQCFPFYVYEEDDSKRLENITDWALEEFRKSVGADVTKWDIFYYVYGLLHCQDYRDKYAANIKRELPKIPLPANRNNFSSISDAGKKLAQLHLGYEKQPEYKLGKNEKAGKSLDWRVTKMKLSKDKTAIIYNDFLTLSGIPPEVFNYKLGNRSALECIIDRYRVATDGRSGIVNDPNSKDDPQYIVKLIGRIITVSLETVRIVSSLNMGDKLK